MKISRCFSRAWTTSSRLPTEPHPTAIIAPQRCSYIIWLAVKTSKEITQHYALEPYAKSRVTSFEKCISFSRAKKCREQVSCRWVRHSMFDKLQIDWAVVNIAYWIIGSNIILIGIYRIELGQIQWGSHGLFLKNISIVHVQNYVDITDFTAHNRMGVGRGGKRGQLPLPGSRNFLVLTRKPEKCSYFDN